jgi:hypothetical protein
MAYRNKRVSPLIIEQPDREFQNSRSYTGMHYRVTLQYLPIFILNVETPFLRAGKRNRSQQFYSEGLGLPQAEFQA